MVPASYRAEGFAVTNDLAGIGDIVVGASGPKNAIHSSDTAGIVGNSLQIAGGSAVTVAGLIGVAGLFATVPAAVAVAVALLGLAASFAITIRSTPT